MIKTEYSSKMMQPFVRTQRYLDKIILKSKKINMKDTILIAGTPRSGTTWLLEIFGTIPEYTSLFEPVNPIWFPESYEIGFRSRTYLPSKLDWLEGEEYLRKAFTGRIFTRVPNYSFKPEMMIHRILGNKLIVKAIGLNRMLPWIADRFELRGIFFIIRHPCAVVASQLKTGWCGYHPTSSPYSDIFPTRENVLEEASKIDGFDHRLLKRLEKIKTREEILASTWCLDNHIPLSSSKPHPWISVIYEKVILDGETEILRLFNEIGEEVAPESTIRNLKVPSMLTLRDEHTVVKNANKQLSKWKELLSNQQVDNILKIVKSFGFDFYTEDIEPEYNSF